MNNPKFIRREWNKPIKNIYVNESESDEMGKKKISNGSHKIITSRLFFLTVKIINLFFIK